MSRQGKCGNCGERLYSMPFKSDDMPVLNFCSYRCVAEFDILCKAQESMYCDGMDVTNTYGGGY